MKINTYISIGKRASEGGVREIKGGARRNKIAVRNNKPQLDKQ